MELPLVVGVDGSDHSLRAVDWAADEAALREVPLRLVYAASWENDSETPLAHLPGKPSAMELADFVVYTAAQRAHRREEGLKVSLHVRHEDPVPALLSEGRSALALVVASRGRSRLAELLLGSVSLGVAARADCPVIVLRGSHDNQARASTRQRVMVGVGEQPHSAAAIRFAFDEAEHRHVVLEAVHVWRRSLYETPVPDHRPGEPSTSHERLAADGLAAALRDAVSDHPSVAVLEHVVEGAAHLVLLDASARADLLVVGAQRRRGPYGLQLGRVAHMLLHHSACPVAVVPQAA
ncbi:universal stress protein [Streptomyces spectabilis]|uniref:Nucleotide-binding universal stress UspA family protein n=1 Tax=Streptomyces spectabilis TaxID=68270 RepID=A0A5P2XLX8_STRST|nr:universal stress protein [Streptomyces spectabilis]MBB5102378.1 nucleotide-binding universal stress UspA family protein [Streptomyces spectabilis]MCI3907423.1 universal stress protein [Streptomyces spectabilis]QEV64135.1 universal stress protein [Streptomyces spectabilis]GGV32178.1 universal stress protein [Streptomyces spectabilis]